MKVVLFGANGRTGRLLTRQALSRGHEVTALTRHPDAFPLRQDGLRVLRGDAFDSESVDTAVAGQDAVLSTIGVPYGLKPITAYSQIVANVVQAMNSHGIRRLACVSSTAMDHQYDNGGGIIFEKVLKPVIASSIGRTTYTDQRRMEALVTDSGLEWTIVRPSGLFETATITDYQVTEGFVTGKFTSRLDLADFMLRQLTDPRYVHKTVAIATVSVRPRLMKMLLTEALHREPRSAAPAR